MFTVGIAVAVIVAVFVAGVLVGRRNPKKVEAVVSKVEAVATDAKSAEAKIAAALAVVKADGEKLAAVAKKV